MVSIGGFTSAIYSAANSYSRAARTENRIADQIGKTGPDFRNNTVNAGIQRRLESQIASWDYSAKMNERSLNRAEKINTYNQMMIDKFSEIKALVIQGAQSSTSQSERDILSEQINAIQQGNQGAYTSLWNSEGTVPLYNSDEGWLDYAASNIIGTYMGGDPSSTSLAYVQTINYSMTMTPGMGALSYASNVTYADNVINNFIKGNRDYSSDIVHNGFDKYIYYGGVTMASSSIESAKAFSEKMSDTLAMGIERLNALDYEQQSYYYAQAQQQKQQATSAMAIANQAQQAYVQTLQYARQNVGQLVNFYGSSIVGSPGFYLCAAGWGRMTKNLGV